MTSIRFVGDLPLWAGLGLALCAALGAWWYYRRESRDLPGSLRWWLPLLRALTFFLVVMTITGPVLHHRVTVGELGRLLVFVDASRSMGVTDTHMPVARKLLIAQEQGWMPAGHVKLTLWEAANQLSQMRSEISREMEADTVTVEVAIRCRDELNRVGREVAMILDQFEWSTLPASASILGTRNWSEIPGQFRAQFLDPAAKLLEMSTSEPDSREDLVRQLQDLCQKASGYEWILRSAFDTYGAQLAASDNRAITSALEMFDDTSRWRRAEDNLLGKSSGLLAKLNSRHEVEVIALSGAKPIAIWDSVATPEVPVELGLEPLGSVTDLGSPVLGEMAVRMPGGEDASAPETSSQRTAVLLFSDGRHNVGGSPLEVARVLGGQSIPVHTIGYGCWKEPPDLAVLSVDHPDLVFQKDHVRGTILLKDHMPPGGSASLQIGWNDEVLWQQQLTTQDAGNRYVDFEFSIDSLVEQMKVRFENDVQHHTLPLALQVSITPLEGETETANNVATMRFAAITQSYRILLIDGRARWETRYVRNVFQRDEQWHIDTVLVGPATDQASLPRGDEADMFPTEKRGLFEYDLIFFGEIPPGTFQDYELDWIRDFVERRGGGLVFLDGQRGHLRFCKHENFMAMLPVAWMSETISQLPTRLRLTDDGLGLAALMLKSTRLENERFWEELPLPHQVVPVEPLPGTEVLAEVEIGNQVLPLLVTRAFGAGRVLYLASDETWRWRYKVADTYHQRFWNQVAKWVMQRPFAVTDEYVSLDSGPPSYESGESAELRVQLRGMDGHPVSDATVDALLWKDGRVVASVSLTPTETGDGVYLGRSGPLAAGEYEASVRASGYANEALKARTEIVVLPPKNDEFEQIACNAELLREISESSAGRFLREEEIGELSGLLAPLSRGRVVESDTLLWQSYWWFTIIIVLLAIEWYTRKRAGLL